VSDGLDTVALSVVLVRQAGGIQDRPAAGGRDEGRATATVWAV
jgi:hypothetical protein